VDYYPYGKVLREFSSTNGKERFLTTHHERDAESGLDYRGARLSDPDVGRFLSLDPHARNYLTWSDYVLVRDNPVRFTDPDGKDWWDMVNGWGRAAVDNMTGLNTRADYNPTDPDDYNHALDATDATMEVHGIGLMAAGMLEMGIGGGAVAASPSTGPASPITAGAGARLILDGALNTTLGTIMYMNASGQGENNYGDDGGSGSGSNDGTGNGGRSRSKSEGTPNSSEIQQKDSSGKTTKYTTYDENGNMVKEYRGVGKPHGKVPRPNVKEVETHTNPATGQQRKQTAVRPARTDEIPK